jgi:flagellar hook-associated protein 2
MSVSSSLSSTSAPVSFTGLASGLNTTSIIQKLMALDQEPVTQMQTQQTNLQNQQSVYTQLSTLMQTLQLSAQSLSSGSTFGLVDGSSSNPDVATISTSNGAQAGNYSLTVNQLAQAQMLVSSAQSSSASALGLTGTFEINGQALQVTASQTLGQIAGNINQLNAGVSANLINGGSGSSYLSLTSSNSGTANAIQFADVSGNVLQTLGIGTGKTSVANPITDGADSYGFSSSTETLQNMVGATTSGAITINGTSVNVNFATDSLQTIAANINQNVSGVTASVNQTTNSSGSTVYQLQMTGTSGTPTLTDSGNVLQSLGILQQAPGSQLVAAQNAEYTLDGVSLTSNSNTVTNVVPDTTITLLQGTKTDPGTTTINLSQDTTDITSALQSFVTSYNGVADYISQNSTLDPTTYATGPLFADPIADQVSNQLSSLLFQNVPGNPSGYNNLASIGFTLSQSGDLQLNTTQLDTALQANPTAVANIFQAVGTGSNSSLTYVTAGAGTQQSNGTPYAVNITQVATQGQYVAGTAQTAASTDSETLTFGGSALSNNNTSLILNVGNTLSDTVAQINGDSALNNVLTASVNSNGELVLSSKNYGANGNFTVSSSDAAAADNTGIGTTTQAPTSPGLDVQGTIDGEPASGNGQFLMGASANTNTAGLEIQYTGTATGAVGTMNYSAGIGGLLNSMINEFTNSTNGIITDENNSLTTEVTNIGTQITQLQAQLTQEQDNLTTEFNNMETAIAALQQQSSELTALTSSSSSTASTTTTPTTSSTGTSSTGSTGTTST